MPAPSSDQRVASLIIPVRTRRYLHMVMDSLERQTRTDFEVLVVDDASSDDVRSYVRKRWPWAGALRLERNVGGAVAPNRGVEATSLPVIGLLNDDIELEPEWFEKLMAELEADPGLAFVTAKLMFHEERDVIYQAGYDFYVYGWIVTRGANEIDQGQWDQPAETVGAAGTASLYRREAWEAAGGNDEDFGMYGEEIDLGLRILMRGWRGRYIPDRLGYHVGGGTTGSWGDRPARGLIRNQLTTVFKNVPGRILLRALPKIVLFHHMVWRNLRAQGKGALVLRSYLGFLRQLPLTLAKRRVAMRARTISDEQFLELAGTEYPFPTRFKRLVRS
jgi:GT2 family glycosyltransferase